LQTNSELYDMEYLETVLKDYNYFTQKNLIDVLFYH